MEVSCMRKVPTLLALTLVLLVTPAGPAGADHTSPRTPLAPTEGAPPQNIVTRGEGTWTFIENFPINPGTDLKFFRKASDWYASSGTLGQADVDHLGQRIIRLTVGG